jgi:homocysteine S-methyltransferase
MTKVLVAINAIFVVCNDRRGEFLASFQRQIYHLKSSKNPFSGGAGGGDEIKPTLTQVALGEDEDLDAAPSTVFHCHLKFQCQSIQKAQEDFLTHSIFLNSPNKEWSDFEASNPFDEEPQAHAWVVAPTTIDDETSTDIVPNPKPRPPGQIKVFCLNADLYVQPQHREEFVAVLENARSCSIQEPCCVEYQYGESMVSPNTFHVHQVYIGNEGGKEGFDLHSKTPHYQRWKQFAAKEPFTKSPLGHTYRTSILVETTQISQGSLPRENRRSQEGLQHITAAENEPNEPDVVLLDGGNGHELKQRGVTDGSFLAGLLANEKQPAVVKSVHRDFCESGCHVITTNSFVAVPLRVKTDILVSSRSDDEPDTLREDAGEDEAVHKRTQELIVSAVRCAKDVQREQRELHHRHVRVAGSVPPLTECYVANSVPDSMEDLIIRYKCIVSTLIDAGVEILLAETLSTKREAIAIVHAFSQLVAGSTKYATGGASLWISLTIDDFSEPPTLRSGEPLEGAINSILHTVAQTGIQLHAIGVNCASPLAVTKAIPHIVTAIKKEETLQNAPRIMVYANGFQTTTSEWLASLPTTESAMANNDQLKSVAHSQIMPKRSDTMGQEAFDSNGVILREVYAKHARHWRDLGASIIGGCCGISPSHMKAVAGELCACESQTR